MGKCNTLLSEKGESIELPPFLFVNVGAYHGRKENRKENYKEYSKEKEYLCSQRTYLQDP
jgi:hypothetical protein